MLQKMRRTPTPTPSRPFLVKRTRSTSTVSQHPGSTLRRRSRCHDDIPSDESDPGERSPFVKTRSRFRKRKGSRNASLSEAVLWMSHRNTTTRPDLGKKVPVAKSGLSVTSHANKQQSPVKKALFPRSLSQSSCADRDRLHIGTTPTTNREIRSPLRRQNDESRLQSEANKILQHGKVLDKSNESMAVGQLQRARNLKNPASNSNWLFYSVWFPAWDVIWKCHDRKSPLTLNKDFRKLITDVVFENAGPDLNATYYLKVMRVKCIDETEGVYKLVGLCEGVRTKVRWAPGSSTMNQLLKTVISPSDLIVQCIPKERPNTSKGETCIVHLTPKDATGVDFCQILNDIKNVQLTMYFLKYEHYVPKVIKCSPISTKNGVIPEPQIQERQHPPVAISALPLDAPPALMTAPQQSSSLNLPIASVDQPPSSVNSPLPPSNSVAGASLSMMNKEIESVIGNDIINAAESPLNDQVEIDPFELDGEIEVDDIDDDECEPASANCNNDPQDLTGSQNVFNLNQFLKTGAFLPGPLRPKARKQERNCYTYNTLAELASLLNDSIAQDVKEGVVPTMTIKHSCNVYGIVDEEVPQSRHENAYFVRISDETMDSVLVRIHVANVGNEANKIIGPKIEVDSIIRIHRLTVQMEWDSGVSDNTMVLSTSSHLNYALFTQSSEENEFCFNSCAKTVHLSDFDRERVGQLHMFKINRATKRQQEMLGAERQHNELDRGASPCNNGPRSDTININHGEDQASRSTFESDGICRSDLSSPSCTVTGSEPTTETNPAEPQSHLQLDDTNDDQHLSNDRSDDSFYSATSDVIQPEVANLTSVADENIGQEVVEPCSVQVTTDTQKLRYTGFRDLAKTDERLNLTCRVKAVYTSSGNNMMHILLSDMEGAAPPKDFQNSLLSSEFPEKSSEFLILNVTNASAFMNRSIFPMLYDAQGTDEFYSIENIKIMGTQPPYILEVDGEICDIKRCQNVLQLVYGMDNSFNTNSVNMRSEMGIERLEKQSDEDFQPAGVPQARLVPIVDDEEHVIDEDMPANPESTDTSTVQSPSQSPVRNLNRNRKRTNNDGKPVESQWTGRLRRKRERREHYQPEDSLEC